MADPHIDGYYRFPTIYRDRVVYVCEDDLWAVPAEGGLARRLTSGLGEATHPRFSPDGTRLAFTGREAGIPEVYAMPAEGGELTRLTWLGASTAVVGWHKDGAVLFASDHGQPFRGYHHLFAVSAEGGVAEALPLGPARAIAFAPKGRGVVIGRNTGDPARWKRYRGGTAGTLWIDRHGRGKFVRLLPEVKGNLASPLWLGERLYFLSDHEGHGNLYSCRPDGGDLRRHTDHEGLFARWPTTDGARIVYHAGADLWLFDPAADRARRIDIEHRSPRTQRGIRFVSAAEYCEDTAVHPEGHSICLTVRGRTARLGAWEGAAMTSAFPGGARQRLSRWLNDGKRVVTVSDEGGEEGLWVLEADNVARRVRTRKDIGRIYDLEVAPRSPDRVAATNHRFELLVIDLTRGTVKVLDQSRHAMIAGFDWSPDGRYLAYSLPLERHVAVIKVAEPKRGRIRAVTRPDFRDVRPSFDPKGDFLYFLSYRDFDPVYDNIAFDLSFPCGVRPFLVTLRKEVRSPFIPVPRPLTGEKLDDDGDDDDDRDDAGAGRNGRGGRAGRTPRRGAARRTKAAKAAKRRPSRRAKKGKPGRTSRLAIDFDGIEDRVLGFPVDDGRYVDIVGIPGKVLFLELPIVGNLDHALGDDEPDGRLEVWDLRERKRETLLEGVTEVALSRDRRAMLYRSGHRLRLLRAGEKPGDDHDEPSRKTGWIDLERVRVAVDPGHEWRQMYVEAWRLQRDHYWSEDMSGIDWEGVRDRYLPLVARVASRSEFSDLLWEMQGELGTSHAYELGGDYRLAPTHRIGRLGCDLDLDPKTGAWRIAHLLRGDGWAQGAGSPLREPGLDIQEGDLILRVAGSAVGADLHPSTCLAALAGEEVELTLLRPGRRQKPRARTVRTLGSDTHVRYRDWVEQNRALVHERSRGRIGYVHIPDMAPRGYAEFHRYFLTEVEREGLIVDIRWNGGGHVSQLLLEKLLRKRVGYDFPRWGQPEPYPLDSVRGPLVALTNEYAGSDGDIFSHCFKLYGLGPLIGKRTWGGVVGIWARHTLVDGTLTTQPEYSFWFRDVGWGIENYGTDPDIEVEITPGDHRDGRDTQLERALAEMARLVEASPPERPERPRRPDLAPPRLPRRARSR